MRHCSRLLLLLAVLLISSCSKRSDTYHVSITAVPTEAGTVTPAEGDFNIGRSLEISAFPNEHWVFERWEGDHTGTNNPAIINLDTDKDIAAIFAKREYNLTVNIEGEGSVSERIVQQKATEYPHGTVVELTANPADNWEFIGWQGDITGAENPAEITIEGEMEVTAVFSKIEYPLTINIVGQGTVTEEIVQAKATDYPFGTVVRLTAEADSGWAFTEWEGDLASTENPAEITIDEPKTVTVNFDRTFRLNTISIPAAGGTIEPLDGTYVRDTSFDVEAIPNDGWQFVEWRGDFTGTTNPFNLTMNGNKTLEAHFEPLSFTLDTTIVGNGHILIDILNGGETEDGYEYGTTLELTAVAETDWSFVRWQGDVSGTINPTLVTIDGSKSVTAVFRFFDGGNGNPGNPYQISTLLQLQAMQDYPDSHFILTQDIDASATSGWNIGAGFMPIGSDEVPFTGGFNGAGFNISNLFMNRPDEQNIGLFGNIGTGVVIQNTILTNADVTGNGNTGALVGQNNGEVLRSHSTGSVSGSFASSVIGGLVGLNNGTVQSSSSNATVIGYSNVGGLVGSNTSDILKSYALGDFSGTDNIGGLLGENVVGGLVSESFAAGSVSASLGNDGGLVGANNATVEISYWDTDSSGQMDGDGDGDVTIGLTGLTTPEMSGPAAETNMSDFNWVETWTTTPASYPILQWQSQ
ncbi:InlB B-repeat-containing protein [Rhodohalobacter sp. 614A]|uniref:InlB B-repeat-containing protein n=1 Tax=Rhodohalobacter sp. 614A TaxID=2908649 RepID=UPI001F204B23|nr:hypothetical protein [Rhodohalobacter sp. 614A]